MSETGTKLLKGFNTPDVISEITSSVELKIYKTQTVRFDSNNLSTEAKILLLIEMHHYPAQIAVILGRSRDRIKVHLRRLVQKGWVEKPSGKYRIYYTLTETGKTKLWELYAGFFTYAEIQVVKRCGECIHFKSRNEMRRGSWKSGKKTVMKCGVKNNPYLPESLRYGNNFSVNHLANDCPLWNFPIYSVCRECVENHYGDSLDCVQQHCAEQI